MELLDKWHIIFHAGQVSDSNPATVAFFGHDRGDARVMKRIAALQNHGKKVIGFTFDRERDKAEILPTWENIHLGTTYNRRYLQRLWAFMKCMRVVWRNRARVRDCKVIYAVNTDTALLALFARRFAGCRVPLVLELADIQAAMTRDGLLSKVFRGIERMVLRRIALLITTSPGFISGYFQPVQGYTGEVFLLENKVYPSDDIPRPVAGAGVAIEGGRPWRIGCFGVLRCRRSLEVMKRLALQLGDRVRFVLRGYPTETLKGEWVGLLGDLPNYRFGGPYVYPDELASMYAGVDFNWAIDETDPHGNSAWLLPNRIYEGGCFGVPVIGTKNTETGRWIDKYELGWTFAEPLAENLEVFLSSLRHEDWEIVKRRCESHPREEFTGEQDYARLMERLDHFLHPHEVRGCITAAG